MEDVLLIDDDTELCTMLTEYLGRYGFRVSAVHRGDSGLEAAHRRAWPMILLDVMLPGIDGFEVLKQIRTFSSGSVLLLTARGEDVDRIVGLEIGADDYSRNRSIPASYSRAYGPYGGGAPLLPPASSRRCSSSKTSSWMRPHAL